MPHTSSEVVICGAGIAGIAAAYHLAVKQGVRNVVLVDERAPMTLTSDKSTEAYRNWWPGPDDAMLRLMNRSIDLLEQLDAATDHRLRLNRRGYLYVTGDPAHVPVLVEAAKRAAQMGAGALRVHAGSAHGPAYIPGNAEDWRSQPDGADLFLDPALIRRHFPYLNPQSLAALHARRCGWFSGQQLGMVMLEQARAAGVRFIAGRVEAVDATGGRVRAVRVATSSGNEHIATARFVNAAGPLVNDVGRLLGLDLPIFSELHLKLALEDRLGVIPRDAPLVIWEDAQHLPWSAEERAALAESAETRHLLEVFPGGVHFRPEGGHGAQTVLLLWAYHLEPVTPTFPAPIDPAFPETVLRGMTTLVPGLAAYLKKLPKSYVDGGYYTKTQENRPLIGPLPVEGAYIFAALSGFGLMAACAGGELLAAHMTGSALPVYAPAFLLSRYEDPTYQQQLVAWGATGQL
ncbi:MAG TPA: FAD-dependent oxidoreductase [Chloroflexi bacterium]|nr:FAD-dependent oxidoreductase [Chloroflexota bacterium]HHW88915.1 FAD-binding oxidoreductase [Chloroflexota bacterium]